MAYIWKCAYCGEEFDYDKGYSKKDGFVICTSCGSDDCDFHYEKDEN